MRFEDCVELLQSASTIEEANLSFSRIAEACEMSAWTIAITETAPLFQEELPPYISTAPTTLQNDYVGEGYAQYDPVLARAFAGRGGPFTWSMLQAYREALSPRRGPTPITNKVMQLAFDHGFKDGLVVPLAGTGSNGRPVMGICSLFSENSVFARTDRLQLSALMMGVSFIAQERIAQLSGQTRENLIDVHLSAREIDVIRYAARGLTVTDTATLLGVSPSTVNNILTSAMDKLGAANKPNLVALALSNGLVSL